MPELFAILRPLIDAHRVAGRFVLLGSASPLLIRHSSDTLAGRIAYHELTPFSLLEIIETTSQNEHWIVGGFPEILLKPDEIFRERWLENFIRTFVERDLAELGFDVRPQNVMRLWQMLVVCGVENIHQSYKHELPMPLDIASLILVYSNPMAIRFRMDERRFDVDGAYNARYEILEKRIDKAHIKGTGERLTQPGKLSIVYTQDWEADEYLEYIKYLQSCNYLDTNIETVGLEDLQGATGLQAFRIAFKYDESPDELIKEMMKEVVA